MSIEEYERTGKDYTQRALMELQDQLKNFNPNKNVDSDDSMDIDNDNNNTIKMTSIQDELSKYRLENSKIITKEKIRDKDKFIIMFEEVMDRNNILIRKNSKLENKLKKLQTEITQIQTREHNKNVFANSKTLENADLLKDKKMLELKLTNKKDEIEKYERFNYIGRFVIGTQFLIMTYMYVVLNADKFLINTNFFK